mgnify:CR=1 FL=1
MLSAREAHFKIHRITNLGLIQGSPLSPILYNIYTADITQIQEIDVKILQYADDVVMYRRISKQQLEKTYFKDL